MSNISGEGKIGTKNLALIVIAVLVAVACVKLGFWQLGRLKEKRIANAKLAAGMAAAPVSAPCSTIERYRKVLLQGVYDYEHQVIVPNRSRQGSPGIHILTPLRVPGNDTAVLVNRGWIYAPDGRTADLGLWREGDTLSGVGYMEIVPPRVVGKPPYPVAPYQAVLIGNTAGSKGIPPRIGVPVFDDGNHLSYAVQWFSFAIIALAGTFIFINQQRKPRDSGNAIPRPPYSF